MKSPKFSLKSTIGIVIVLFLFGCQPSISKIDLTHLNTKEKEEMGTRIKRLVEEKEPFQGSLTHQQRCDTLIALNYEVAMALQEKSTPYTKIGDYHIAFPLLEKSAELEPRESLYYYSWAAFILLSRLRKSD